MTSKSLATPLFRLITARGYAQAAPAGVSYKLECGVLPNSILVAANDNGSPVTQVTVAFKAGSRFEPTTELGLTHVLRSSSGLSTKNSSGFLIARKLAQIGANVTTSGDREFVYYSLEVHCKYLDSALDHLSDLISNQEFRPWELTDNEARLKYDIAAVPPQVRAIDLLHRVAYRRTLGNSLFIAPKKIGKISTESLQHFYNKNLCPTRCAISVVGGNTDVAKYIGQQLTLGQGGEGQNDASSYYGGEARKEIGGDLAHVALAYQGAAAGTPQALALAIAAKALGNGPMIKWGNDHSPLNKAIGNIGPFAAAGFNVSYSDNGLYGLVLSVPKDEAKAAVCAAASVLKTPQSITGPQIQAGKNQLILQVLSESEAGSSYSESLTTQLLYSGTVRNTSDLVSAIQQIPESDIYQAVSQAVCTKLSMGSVGNLAFVPYVDEV